MAKPKASVKANAKSNIIDCLSYTLRVLNQRPNIGTAFELVSFDDLGKKGNQNGAVQTTGPDDRPELVKKIFRALAKAWPDKKIQFVIDAQDVIIDVV